MFQLINFLNLLTLIFNKLLNLSKVDVVKKNRMHLK